MERLLVAAIIAAAAVAVALVIRRRGSAVAPVVAPAAVPAQLDRSDFEFADRPWLVAVFSSVTCASCADVVARAMALAGPAVAVEEVEAGRRRDLHRRYGVTGVPVLVIADELGVVRESFVGPLPPGEPARALGWLQDHR